MPSHVHLQKAFYYKSREAALLAIQCIDNGTNSESLILFTGKVLVGSDYSFATVAAPYAQELLDVQTARTFALSELGKQVQKTSKESPLPFSPPPLPSSS